MWRQAAENVAESLQKGMRVVVQGNLRSRQYETREGEKRTVFEIQVDEVGPSLKYATAKVTRTQRSGGSSYGGGQQGGGQGGPSDNDPWATPAAAGQGQAAAGAAAALRPTTRGRPRASARRAAVLIGSPAPTTPRSQSSPSPPFRPPRRPGSLKGSTTMAKAVMRKPKKKVCQFCKEKATGVDYKDTTLLRKFISDRGKIRARRVTGNCVQHQRDVAIAVKNARELALLPYTSTGR